MTPQQRLAELRSELAAIEPYPWDGIAAWTAKAKTCIRAHYTAHLEDFEEVTSEPRWLMFPRVVRVRSRWDEPHEVAADAARERQVDRQEEQSNRERALNGRQRIVAFLDGLLAEAGTVPKAPDSTQRVDLLLERFSLVASALEKRGRSRPALVMNDEYDVQYLLGALLRLDFDDVRAEEWTPSYAGGSARVDFLLKKQGIIIETKRTRDTLLDKGVGDELLADIARYQIHPDCGLLLCFVYDPERRLANPRGLEQDLSKNHGGLPVRLLVRS